MDLLTAIIYQNKKQGTPQPCVHIMICDVYTSTIPQTSAISLRTSCKIMCNGASNVVMEPIFQLERGYAVWRLRFSYLSLPIIKGQADIQLTMGTL